MKRLIKPKKTVSSARNSTIKHVSSLSKGHLLVVALIFGAIGGYILIHSFAAAPLPDVELAGPTPNSSQGGLIDFTAGVTDNSGTGIKTVTFKVDGVAKGTGTYTGPSSSGDKYVLLGWDSSTVSNGLHVFSAEAQDNATPSHINSASFNYVVDNSKPTISLDSPGSNLSGTVTLTSHVTDNIGVDWVHFILTDPAQATDCPTVHSNGKGCLFLGMGEPSSLAASRNGMVTTSWDTTKAPNGTYTVNATAYDATGSNNGGTTSNSVTFTVNNAVPTYSTLGQAVADNPYMVDQAWQCTGSTSYNSVNVLEIDKPATPGTGAANGDSVQLGGCSNMSITKLNIVSDFNDAIKGGGDHITLSSGVVRCYDRVPINHQDAMQSLSGNVVSFNSFDFRCYTANNSDFYLTHNKTDPPGTDGANTVTCDHCFFGGGASNTVFIASNTKNSGITYSDVCAGGNQGIRIGTGATPPDYDPVNPSPHSTSLADLNFAHDEVIPATDPRCAMPAGIFAQSGDVDLSPPTVSVTTPTAAANITGPATLTATASDNKAVESVQFQIDGVNVGPPLASSPYTYNWDSSTVGNGSHIITAIAWDNTSSTTSSSVSVTTNNVGAPPSPTVNLSASPTTVSIGGSTTLTWTTTNATNCTASGGWSGNKATNNSEVVGSLLTTSTFTLTCTGPGGNGSDSKTVNVSGVLGDVWGPGSVPDGHINIFDLTRVLSKFGTSDPNYDFWGPAGHADGIVNMFDVTYITNHYGS
jgi:hypothetical protein